MEVHGKGCSFLKRPREFLLVTDEFLRYINKTHATARMYR